jgi:four helix bundle protein
VQNYRELKVWQKAHQVVLAVYRVTREFPKDELYALTSQVRRAAVSIGANLAEGCGRHGRSEFAHFVSIASGSASELDYELLVARDLEYLAPEAHERICHELDQVRMMLNALHQRLTTKD